jgi:hypothetical protein
MEGSVCEKRNCFYYFGVFLSESEFLYQSVIGSFFAGGVLVVLLVYCMAWEIHSACHFAFLLPLRRSTYKDESPNFYCICYLHLVVI